jgi:hypothetical protein
MKQKLAELINVIFGMRKFILMVILYVVGIVFRIQNLLSGAEMVDLFKATTIAFMGANGVEHLVIGVKAVMAGRQSPALPDGDSIADVAGTDGSK